MIAWAQVFAWPVAAVVIALQARRAVIAVALAWWTRDPLSLPDLPTGMEPVPGFEPDGSAD